MTLRLAKIVLPLMLAAYAFIVAWDNVVDYGSNLLFVQHVLAMDTTFPGNALMGRAIASPVLWHAAYGLIILAESTTCLLLLGGSVALWRARRASAARFHAAKGLVTAGCVVAFLLWFFGFMVVGGEWFAMWQSKSWNGQDGAFRIYMAILGVLIFVNQTDGDLPGSDAGR